MTRHVRDVMEREPIAVGQDATFKEIARLMAEHRLSAVPVVEDDGHVLGVVSEADLIVRDEPFGRPQLLEGRVARAWRRKEHAASARDLMTVPPVVIGPEESLAETAALMRTRRVKRVPVCDTHQRLLGVVSRMDLVREFLRDDAEICAEVTHILEVEMSIPLDEVRPSVEDGVVTLQGRVEHRSQVAVIVDRIRRVAGSVEVVPRLNWVEDDTVVELGPLPWVGF